MRPHTRARDRKLGVREHFFCFLLHFILYAWAQLGGEHGGRAPPTFSDSGDIICQFPTFFSLGFAIYWFHTKLSPHILQQNCAYEFMHMSAVCQSLYVCATKNFCALLTFTENLAPLVLVSSS